jgi:pyridoxal phosphate enzyme (YggS family)
VSEVAAALGTVRDRIAAAARRAGRSTAEIRLVAISKKQPLHKLREAYAAGQRDFGENYAQELVEKAQALADLPDIRWHFVGHLQRNKAKLVAPLCELIHTVDSVDLAETLLRRAGRGRVRCLVEVNLGDESQKGGVSAAETGALCQGLAALPRLSLEGLMCLPPLTGEPRDYFRRLRELRDSIVHGLDLRLPELSMGMSEDFEAAIEEGATWVRLGTIVFGKRE